MRLWNDLMTRICRLLVFHACLLSAAASAESVPAQQAFWENLQSLCGQAFAGRLTDFSRPADEGWLDREVIIHVRRCSATEIRIPLHVGTDRSRTWVLRRSDQGLTLKHDHRHEDGSEDPVSWYGGHTTDAGRSWRQTFPADDYSKALFLALGLDVSVGNFWSMEVHSDVQMFAYELVRPGRRFRAEFDLSDTVESPPAPWGHN